MRIRDDGHAPAYEPIFAVVPASPNAPRSKNRGIEAELGRGGAGECMLEVVELPPLLARKISPTGFGLDIKMAVRTAAHADSDTVPWNTSAKRQGSTGPKIVDARPPSHAQTETKESCT